jgi:hypothetical protein
MMVLASSFISERTSEGSFANQPANTLPAPRSRL